MSFWQQFASPAAEGRWKPRQAGDTIEGVITRLTATDFGGTGLPTPVIAVVTPDGFESEVTASWAVLVSRLVEADPNVGDWIKITYDGDATSSRPGRSPAKLFTVVVKRAGGVAGTTPPANPPAPTPPPIPETWSDEPF